MSRAFYDRCPHIESKGDFFLHKPQLLGMQIKFLYKSYRCQPVSLFIFQRQSPKRRNRLSLNFGELLFSAKKTPQT